jgi:hypothetical protein
VTPNLKIEISRATLPSYFVCGILLLTAPGMLLAQHRGRGGGGKTGSTGAGDTESPEAKEFERAAALQARPEQVTAFQQLAKSDQTARKNVAEFLQHAQDADQPDLFHRANSITVAVEEAQSENTQFLLSFSNAQKSGLKELTKRLAKANSDLTKEDKALSHELERSKVNERQLAEVVQRLDKALADFQARQTDIGTEMGIPATDKPL